MFIHTDDNPSLTEDKTSGASEDEVEDMVREPDGIPFPQPGASPESRQCPPLRAYPPLRYNLIISLTV